MKNVIFLAGLFVAGSVQAKMPREVESFGGFNFSSTEQSLRAAAGQMSCSAGKAGGTTNCVLSTPVRLGGRNWSQMLQFGGGRLLLVMWTLTKQDNVTDDGLASAAKQANAELISRYGRADVEDAFWSPGGRTVWSGPGGATEIDLVFRAGHSAVIQASNLVAIREVHADGSEEDREAAAKYAADRAYWRGGLPLDRTVFRLLWSKTARRPVDTARLVCDYLFDLRMEYSRAQAFDLAQAVFDCGSATQFDLRGGIAKNKPAVDQLKERIAGEHVFRFRQRLHYGNWVADSAGGHYETNTLRDERVLFFVGNSALFVLVRNNDVLRHLAVPEAVAREIEPPVGGIDVLVDALVSADGVANQPYGKILKVEIRRFTAIEERTGRPIAAVDVTHDSSAAARGGARAKKQNSGT